MGVLDPQGRYASLGNRFHASGYPYSYPHAFIGDAPRRIESFGSGDQLSIKRGQTGEVG
jgi:hypothetical protein